MRGLLRRNAAWTTVSALLCAMVLRGAESEKPDDAAHQDPIPQRVIDYTRDISPIFSQHCLECHGPDAKAREGGFRLDRAQSATGAADSGRIPITPGNLKSSHLFSRITSTDPDHRMPPPSSGASLSSAETELIRDWILQGAPYHGHWAFQPILKRALPSVENRQWPIQPLDYFVLRRLEERSLTPSSEASRSQWLRRVHIDLIGLPPTPLEIERFLSDTTALAYDRVVDRLLSSPRYGERWGRHWLDVARYGDSNGGDENHAYPNAHHYRNYVIDALNAGVPYDQFITEQLAGDLLPDTTDLPTQLNRIKATGFLAIGTKILAEQDPVKKLADTIDEQIDTVSKSLLGVTVACARCHDHKFDPIPTKDYYAFAGIFHSTQIGEHPLKSAAFQAQESDYRKRLEQITSNLEMAESEWQNSNQNGSHWERQAESFDRGNVTIDTENYGVEIGIISDPGGQDNYSEYDLTADSTQQVAIEIRYAAKQPRPGTISLNGSVIQENAFAHPTGGWHPEHQRWHFAGTGHLKAGTNVLRFESKPMMVHIDRFRIVPFTPDSSTSQLISRLTHLRQEKQQLENEAPQAPIAMSVSEGKIQNVRVHVRGDHNSLGDEVARGFLTEIGPEETNISPSESGRLQLATWLTQPKHPLTARVIANRLWRWHFGKGLSSSTENFGTRGNRPSHPHLLDFLAHTLIANDWSLKQLQRMIVLSRTYRLSSENNNPSALSLDPSNELYWKRDIRRLEAEAFRDSLLYLSGRLSSEIGGGPMNVKSQDPSPQDLVANREKYEESPRRSVYLPVVRSNVYDFLTLLDFPNANSPVGNRPTTTVPTQALMMMNHDFVRREASTILQRLQATHERATSSELIDHLYLQLLGRQATEEDQQLAGAFIQAYDVTKNNRPADVPQPSALEALCHSLLMSNEFAYVR